MHKSEEFENYKKEAIDFVKKKLESQDIIIVSNNRMVELHKAETKNGIASFIGEAVAAIVEKQMEVFHKDQNNISIYAVEGTQASIGKVLKCFDAVSGKDLNKQIDACRLSPTKITRIK